MRKRKRYLYGWLKGGKCLLSRLPPDVSVPYQSFSGVLEAAEAARASKYEIIWCGEAAAEFARLEAERAREPIQSRW